MTSVTTTSGAAGAVTGAAFLHAIAASASATAKAATASEKIPSDLSQLRCDLIRPSIMLKCETLGGDASGAANGARAGVSHPRRISRLEGERRRGRADAGKEAGVTPASERT